MQKNKQGIRQLDSKPPTRKKFQLRANHRSLKPAPKPKAGVRKGR